MTISLRTSLRKTLDGIIAKSDPFYAEVRSERMQGPMRAIKLFVDQSGRTSSYFLAAAHRDLSNEAVRSWWPAVESYIVENGGALVSTGEVLH